MKRPMQHRMFRIALLGAGTMARAHIAAHARLADVELIHVAARDDGAVRASFEDRDVDAIDICLPSAIHARFAIPALEHGKHVFCETPMALDLTAAGAMRDAARKADRLLQVGLLMRSVAGYRHIKDLTESGMHGRLLSLSTWRLGSYLRSDAPDRKAHYSDPTTELMTFDLDFANWLMGRPARISAAGTGDVSALLHYGDGRHATIMASGQMPVGAPFTAGFRVLFADACFELQQIFGNGPPRVTFTIADGASPPRPVVLDGGNPYEIELRRFVDCMAGQADPQLLDADRAIEALTLSLDIRRALSAAPGAGS